MHLTIKREQIGQAKFVFENERRNDYDHTEADGVEVFVYGYPYHNINKTWISARQVSHYYLQNEFDFVTDVEGSYAIIILDRQKGKCLVIIDRCGIYNFLYTKHGETLTISDNMGELLTELPKVRVNRRSLLEFLNFNFVCGDKTHIEGVYQFKPATVHTISSGLHITENSYWQYITQEDGEFSKALSKEELRDLFNQNILTAFQLGEKVSLPLTGGLDSRVEFSACLPKKERLHCYTHGIEGCLDIEIARRIAAIAGISHDVYTLGEEWVKNIPQAAGRLAQVLDGMVNAILSAHLENSITNEMAGGRGEVFLTGVGGEMLRCPYARPDLLDLTSHEDVAANLCERMRVPPAPLDVYTDYDPTEVKLLLDASMLEEIKNVKTKNPVLLSEHFYVRNIIGNFSPPGMRMFGRHFKIFNPFLHANILGSIPFFDREEKWGGKLHRYIFSKNSSQFASMPTRNEEIARMRKAVSKQPVYKGVANQLARKLLGKEIFRSRSTGGPSVIDRTTDYTSWLRNYHSEYVINVLDHDRMILKEFFNKERLNSVVNSFLSDEGSLYYFVTNVMTLEIWLRKMSERTKIEIH